MAEIADLSNHLPVVWVEETVNLAEAASVGSEVLSRSDATTCFRLSYEEALGFPKALADVPAATLLLVVPRRARIHDSLFSRNWSRLIESATHSAAVVAVAYDSTFTGWQAWLEGSALAVDMSSEQGRGELERLIRAGVALESTQLVPSVLPAHLQRLRFVFERLVRTQPLTAAALKLALCDELDAAGISDGLGIEATSAADRLEFARQRLNAVCPAGSAPLDLICETLQPKRGYRAMSGIRAVENLAPSRNASAAALKPSLLQLSLQSQLAERSSKVRHWYRRCAQLLEAGMPVEVVLGYSWALVEQLMRRSVYVRQRAAGVSAREARISAQVEHLGWKEFQSSFGTPLPPALTAQPFRRAKVTRDQFLHGVSPSGRAGPTGRDMARSCHAAWIWSEELQEWMTGRFGIGPLDDLRRMPRRARSAPPQKVGQFEAKRVRSASLSIGERPASGAQRGLKQGAIWAAVQQAGLASTSHDLSCVPQDLREIALRASLSVSEASPPEGATVEHDPALEQLVVVHSRSTILVMQECPLSSNAAAFPFHEASLYERASRLRRLVNSYQPFIAGDRTVMCVLVLPDLGAKAVRQLANLMLGRPRRARVVLCTGARQLRALLKSLHSTTSPGKGSQAAAGAHAPPRGRRGMQVQAFSAAFESLLRDSRRSVEILSVLREMLDRHGWSDISLPGPGEPVPAEVQHEVLARARVLDSNRDAEQITVAPQTRRGVTTDSSVRPSRT